MPKCGGMYVRKVQVSGDVAARAGGAALDRSGAGGGPLFESAAAGDAVAAAVVTFQRIQRLQQHYRCSPASW